MLLYAPQDLLAGGQAELIAGADDRFRPVDSHVQVQFGVALDLRKLGPQLRQLRLVAAIAR